MIDERVFLRPIKVGRRREQTVQIRLPVARLDGDRRWRFPAHRTQSRDIRRLQRHDRLSIQIAQHGYLRHIGLRVSVNEILTGRRQRDFVVRIFGREQAESRPVHSNLVEMSEVRIAPSLPRVTHEP